MPGGEFDWGGRLRNCLLYTSSENLDHTEGDTELATAVEEENQEAIDNMDEKDAAEQDLAEESSSGQSDEPETLPEESPDTGTVEEPVQEVLSQAVQQPEQYTVKTGDTLSRISRQRYGTCLLYTSCRRK